MVNRVVVSTRIPPALRLRVKKYALKRGLKLEALIEQALIAFLDDSNNNARVTQKGQLI